MHGMTLMKKRGHGRYWGAFASMTGFEIRNPLCFSHRIIFLWVGKVIFKRQTSRLRWELPAADYHWCLTAQGTVSAMIQYWTPSRTSLFIPPMHLRSAIQLTNPKGKHVFTGNHILEIVLPAKFILLLMYSNSRRQRYANPRVESLYLLVQQSFGFIDLLCQIRTTSLVSITLP